MEVEKERKRLFIIFTLKPSFLPHWRASFNTSLLSVPMKITGFSLLRPLLSSAKILVFLIYPPSHKRSTASEYFEKFKSFISDPLSARRTYIAIHCPLISLGTVLSPNMVPCNGIVFSFSIYFRVKALGRRKYDADTARHQ